MGWWLLFGILDFVNLESQQESEERITGTLNIRNSVVQQ